MSVPTEAPAQPSPPPGGRQLPDRWRLAVLVVLGVLAAALVVLLFVGVDSTRLRVVVLLAASAAIAALAALLPTSWRARSALVVTVFVAAAGVLPVVVTNSSPSPPGPGPTPVTTKPAATVNADYLAELIRKGPFTEPLPAPLAATGLVAADEAGAGSAHRVDATQVEMSSGGDPAYPGLAVYAFIETYRTEAGASDRAEAALADAQRRLMVGGSTGDASGFTVSADGYWVCGGWRGLTYAELELSPDPSSTEAIASGTLSALLDYAARMSKLAESD